MWKASFGKKDGNSDEFGQFPASVYAPVRHLSFHLAESRAVPRQRMGAPEDTETGESETLIAVTGALDGSDMIDDAFLERAVGE